MVDNRIVCLKVNKAMDLYKTTSLATAPKENGSCFLPNPKPKKMNDTEILLAGKQMDILLEVKQEKISEDKMMNQIFKFEHQTQKRVFLCFKDGGINNKKIDGKDICGFTFGGISSRFWVAKNKINLLPRDSSFKDEHFCWNMITIFLKQNEK